MDSSAVMQLLGRLLVACFEKYVGVPFWAVQPLGSSRGWEGSACAHAPGGGGGSRHSYVASRQASMLTLYIVTSASSERAAVAAMSAHMT
jgi:hypothetical protein